MCRRMQADGRCCGLSQQGTRASHRTPSHVVIGYEIGQAPQLQSSHSQAWQVQNSPPQPSQGHADAATDFFAAQQEPCAHAGALAFVSVQQPRSPQSESLQSESLQSESLQVPDA